MTEFRTENLTRPTTDVAQHDGDWLQMGGSEMASCVRELAESGMPVPRECKACGDGLCKRDAEAHGMHYVQLQMRHAELAVVLREARDAIANVECPKQHQVVDLIARIDAAISRT